MYVPPALSAVTRPSHEHVDVGDEPHWCATPPPPHVCPALQDPQFIKRPQPFGTEPH
jgi:hypothetical protein